MRACVCVCACMCVCILPFPYSHRSSVSQRRLPSSSCISLVSHRRRQRPLFIATALPQGECFPSACNAKVSRLIVGTVVSLHTPVCALPITFDERHADSCDMHSRSHVPADIYICSYMLCVHVYASIASTLASQLYS